ncbi:MAG: hypothetical protein HY905_27060 [Deltaproteobacteria bacterium]|nr:hypothetical protein [Deltaproteobacteria bacterium]
MSGRLAGFLFREGQTWVACCASLDLASGGPTQAAALDATQHAIRLWLDSCVKRGTLERALAELGWVCQTADGSLADCGTQRIPPAFVIDAVRRRGRDWSQPIRFVA